MPAKKSTAKPAAKKVAKPKVEKVVDPAVEQQGTADPALVTPVEHSAATSTIEPGEHVSDPGVPTDVEIAARSADMEAPSEQHEKTFVLGPAPRGHNSTNPYTEARGYDHEPNKAATRQYAIDAGLWPTGDVGFVGGKRHPDGESWILTYAVPVIPANDAPDGSQSPTVVASDGDATGATNYAPSSESGDETAA